MINTKPLMIITAVILAAIGICLIFLPDETAVLIGIGSVKYVPLIFQILGALYFAFAVLNWMSKDKIIGGIYSRPVAVGNFTHFFVGGLVLLKAASSGQNVSTIWLLCILYLLLAVSFGLLFFRHPVK